MLRARVGHGREEGFNKRKKRRDVGRCHRPDLPEVDAVIGVNEHVPHSSDLTPRNLGMSLAEVLS